MLTNKNTKRLQASQPPHRSKRFYTDRFSKCAIDQDQLEFPIKSWSNLLQRQNHKKQVFSKQRPQAIPLERINERQASEHLHYDPNTIVMDYAKAKKEKNEIKQSTKETKSNIRIVDASKQVHLMFNTVEVAMERGEAIGTDEIRESWKSLKKQ